MCEFHTCRCSEFRKVFILIRAHFLCTNRSHMFASYSNRTDLSNTVNHNSRCIPLIWMSFIASLSFLSAFLYTPRYFRAVLHTFRCTITSILALSLPPPIMCKSDVAALTIKDEHHTLGERKKLNRARSHSRFHQRSCSWCRLFESTIEMHSCKIEDQTI